MLVASARHPAMLTYLDNANSDKDAPNENYARELLELHTVGVDAGYTEAMVKSAARLLTGLSVDDRIDAVPLRHLQARDRPRCRCSTSGTPTERRTARRSAIAYLRYLAAHPATARRIARKLAVRFVSDDPPAALVTELAKVYRRSDTDDRAGAARALPVPGVQGVVGRQGAPPVRGHGRRPSGRSASGRRRRAPTASASSTGSSGSLGQPPLGWHPPDGYPDVADLVAQRRRHPGPLELPPRPGRRLVARRPPAPVARVAAAAAPSQRRTARSSTPRPPGWRCPGPTDAVRRAVSRFLGHAPGDRLRRRRRGARLAAALGVRACCSTAPAASGAMTDDRASCRRSSRPAVSRRAAARRGEPPQRPLRRRRRRWSATWRRAALRVRRHRLHR